MKVIEQINYCDDRHPTLGKVNVIYDDSKRFIDGGLSIGKKRQALVERADANYLCFLDDDEDISPNYVETLLRLCYYGPDVCTFRNISKFDNYWCVVDMSLQFENEQASPLGVVKRKPWHICPVRSKLAKSFEFEDSNYGEDFTWMAKVLTQCHTERKTDEIIHEYRHSSKISEADKAYAFTK